MSLVELIRLHTLILRGAQPRVDDVGDLGEYGVLLVSEGLWRPDGPFRVRRMLSEVLSEWPGIEKRPGSIGAVARLWGVSGPPLTPTEFHKMLKVDGSLVSVSLLRSWEASALTFAHQHRACVLRRAAPVPHPAGVRALPRIVAHSWPSVDDWAGLRTAAQSEFLASISDPLLRELIRDHVETSLRDRYLAHVDTVELAHYAGRFLFSEWQTVTDRIAPVFPASTENLRDLHWSLAAIVQMFSFDALDDGRLKSLLGSRQRLTRFLRTSPPGHADALQLLEDLHPTLRQALEESLASDVTSAADEEADEAEGQFMALSSMNGIAALAFADLITDSAKSRTPRLIEKYISLREALGPTPSAGRGHGSPAIDARIEDIGSQLDLLALADQSVHLEVTRRKDSLAVRRLGRIIESSGATRYRDLVRRNVAIDLRLESQSTTRLGILLQLEQKSRAPEKYSDMLEATETSQQVSMQLASTCVRIVESHLKSPFALQDELLFNNVCQRALEWSRIAVIRLADVVTARGGELPTDRRLDGSISRSTWRQTALEVRHRALLAVSTAIGSGLTAPIAGEDCSITALNHAFAALVSTPDLAASMGKNLGMQGTWLALLNGGAVPHVAAGSSVLFRSRLEFLYRSAPELTGDADFVQCDFALSAAWHRDIVEQRGTLGDIASPRVLSYLNEVSDGAYAQWLARLNQPAS